jgi:hypothetical protein
MLHFGVKLPFSFERFLALCRDFIPEEDLNILKKISIEDELAGKSMQPALNKWYDFDRSLRNELTKIRASRKHLDPAKYIRGDSYSEASVVHIAMSAHRTPSILEAEKVLDQARWQFLNELELGHFFDLDFLIIYALKLLILERWDKINSANKAEALEEALQ